MNRNFTALFTRAVVKAVHRLPPPWQPNVKGKKGHDPKIVAIGCLLIVGFNETYDGIEVRKKDSQILQELRPVLPGHSVIHRGMTRLLMNYIRKTTNLVIRFLRRKDDEKKRHRKNRLSNQDSTGENAGFSGRSILSEVLSQKFFLVDF